MSYDPEYAVTQMIGAYLKAELPEETQATCPVVTFIDEMEVPEERSRFIVDVLVSTNDAHMPANFAANIELGVKSDWKQPSIVADLARHRARVQVLRGLVMFSPDGMIEVLTEYLPAGLAIEFVQPSRQFTTRKHVDGWFYSETSFQVQCYSVATS